MKIRLTEPCQINDVVHERDTVIDGLPADWKGPHRAHRISHDRIDYGTDPPIDANRALGKLEDRPCYEILELEADIKPLVRQHFVERHKAL